MENKVVIKTRYELWLENQLFLGGFAEMLMVLYNRADLKNREKLKKAFPEWFVEKK